jgi:hypothetical protein
MTEEETRRTSERGEYYVVHPAVAFDVNAPKFSASGSIGGANVYNSGNVKPLGRDQISAMFDRAGILDQAGDVPPAWRSSDADPYPWRRRLSRLADGDEPCDGRS